MPFCVFYSPDRQARERWLRPGVGPAVGVWCPQAQAGDDVANAYILHYSPTVLLLGEHPKGILTHVLRRTGLRVLSAAAATETGPRTSWRPSLGQDIRQHGEATATWTCLKREALKRRATHTVTARITVLSKHAAP